MKKRSVWHTDLKWTSGVLLVVFLFLALVTFILFQMTAKEFAVESLSKIVSLSFATNNKFNERKIELLRDHIIRGQGDYYRPFPGLNLIINKKDVSGLSINEIRTNINRRFSERLYENGPIAFWQMIEKKKLRDEISAELWTLSFINRASHQRLEKILISLLIISSVFMACLIYFSNGFNRLINPGLAFLIVSLPGFVWIKFINNISSAPLLKETPRHENDLSGLIGAILKITLPPTAEKLYPINIALFIFGIALLIVAGAVMLSKRLLRHG